MEIEISNRISVRNAPQSILDGLVSYLTISNPKYEDALRQGRKGWGIDPFIYNFGHIHGGIIIPRGCRVRLLDLTKSEGINDVEVIDNRTRFKWREIESSGITYRSYQSKPMTDLSIKEEGLLVAPAGSGKTVMGLSLVPLFGQPTLWLTHTDRLAKQVLERVKTFLPGLVEEDMGLIGGGKWKIGKIFTVGMVQTLVRREEELDHLKNLFGLVILDEAHHCPASTFLKVISHLNPFYLFGLTATAYRRDRLEIIMSQALGETIAVIKSSEVEKAGGIMVPTVKYRSIRLKKRLKEDDPARGSNTQAIMKAHIINNGERNNIIVGDVVREALLGNYCIVVSGRKIHCETLYNLISIGWKKTGIATGSYTVKYRDEQVRRFYDNEITVLVTTFELLGEGFDVDFLNRAFIATPFRARGRTEQLAGRLGRTAEGKKDAIVYDYVDVDIGVIRDQFFSTRGGRHKTYKELGMHIEPI